MSLRFGLLGLLTYCPMAGYDLKKIFEDSVNYFWSAQTSQIYRELKLLESSGHVTSVVEPGSAGPNKRVYSITESGRQELRAWLLDTEADIQEDNKNEFLLKVFLSSNIGPQELMGLLEKRLEKYKKDLDRLLSSQSKVAEYKDRFDVERELLFWKISMNRGFHDIQSHIRWAEESIEFLKSLGFSSSQ